MPLFCCLLAQILTKLFARKSTKSTKMVSPLGGARKRRPKKLLGSRLVCMQLGDGTPFCAHCFKDGANVSSKTTPVSAAASGHQQLLPGSRQIIPWMNESLQHFEAMVETTVCWYLRGNRHSSPSTVCQYVESSYSGKHDQDPFDHSNDTEEGKGFACSNETRGRRCPGRTTPCRMK